MDRKRLIVAIILSLGLHAAILSLTGQFDSPAADEANPRPSLTVAFREAGLKSNEAPLVEMPIKELSPIEEPVRDESMASQPATPHIEPSISAAVESGGFSEKTEKFAKLPSGLPAGLSANLAPIPTPPSTEPAPLEPIKPQYPMMARRMGLEGTVVLILTINEAGRVEDYRIQETQAHPLLVDAAVETAMAGRYAPGTRGLKPVTDTLTLRIVFRLET